MIADTLECTTLQVQLVPAQYQDQENHELTYQELFHDTTHVNIHITLLLLCLGQPAWPKTCQLR